MQALNTGHDGSLSTVHANSALDAIHRLETLVLQTAPTWPLVAVRSHLLRCVDAVVHVERSAGGARRVVEIAELSEDLDITLGDRPITRTIVKGDTVVAALRRSRAWGRT
ncbi:MAG: CpaF/VirB11 family protein [Actinomycetota bacterium]|nr:CpaF/VirB11 family protein [Actinomycetota bacterium]